MINYGVVLVAAIASMAVGALWYGPVFGKLWIKLSRMTDKQLAESKKKGMGKSYALAFIGTLVTAGVLAYLAGLLGIASATAGAIFGFWAWLGFVIPLQLGGVLWEQKPWSLFLLGAAHELVNFLMVGAIVGGWG